MKMFSSPLFSCRERKPPAVSFLMFREGMNFRIGAAVLNGMNGQCLVDSDVDTRYVNEVSAVWQEFGWYRGFSSQAYGSMLGMFLCASRSMEYVACGDLRSHDGFASKMQKPILCSMQYAVINIIALRRR